METYILGTGRIATHYASVGGNPPAAGLRNQFCAGLYCTWTRFGPVEPTAYWVIRNTRLWLRHESDTWLIPGW